MRMLILLLIALSSVFTLSSSFSNPLRITSSYYSYQHHSLNLYSSTNPVNCESKVDPCKENETCSPTIVNNLFLLNIESTVTLEEISNENIAKIVNLGY